MTGHAQSWRRLRSWCIIGLVHIVLSATATIAHAEERGPSAVAKQRFESARELSKKGDHRAAILLFGQSYEVAPLPATLYMLGREYYLLFGDGSLDDGRLARDAFNSYLAKKPDATNRTEVNDYIIKIETALAEAAARDAAEKERLAHEAAEAAAREQAAQEQAARERAGQRELKPGGPVKAVAPSATSEPPTTDSGRGARLRQIAGGLVLAVGTIAAAAGIGLLVSAAEGEAAATHPMATLDDYTRSYAPVDTLRGAGGALLGIGGAAIVAGIVVLALPKRPKPDDRAHALWIAPQVSGTAGEGTGLLIGGRF